MKKVLKIVVILIVVILVGAGVSSFGKKDVKKDVTSSEPQIEQNVSLPLPNDWLEYDTSSQSYQVVKGTSELSASVIMPNTYDDGINGEANVTNIKQFVFDGCDNLTSVIIPSSITTIGQSAFRDCTSLAKVVFEDNCQLASIGNSSFSGCTSLNNLILPLNLTSIGSSAFYNCSNLVSIIIPVNVTKISVGAFAYCSNLSNVIVEAGNTIYDSRDNCNAIIETSTNKLIQGCCTTIIPTTVTQIGAYAFNGHSALSSINIPASVESIIVSAFYDCPGLTNIVVENGNAIYDSRDNCNSIIEIATNTLIIGCKDTIIPDTITSIGQYAFKGCTGLTNIVIPNNVTDMADFVFNGCTNLKNIVVEEGNEIYDSRDNCNAIIETSSNSLIYGASSTTIPSNVTSIGKSAFYGRGALTSITIPSGVTNIGQQAFYYCENLTSIIFEDNSQLDSIGTSSFEGCSELTIIDIPSSATTISTYAFKDCDSLKSVTIPTSVTSISNGAFQNCISLTSVIIPESITSIKAYLFSGCNSLISITILATTPPTLSNTNAIPDNVTAIYIPAGTLEAYQTATKWSTFADKFVELEA